MDKKRVGLECLWKVRQCSSVMDTTTRARATCRAGCEERLFFERHFEDSMARVLSHARKKHVCGRATYAWVECSVYTAARQATEAWCVLDRRGVESVMVGSSG